MKAILSILVVTVFIAQNSWADQSFFTPICRILKKLPHRCTAKEVELNVEYQGDLEKIKSYKVYNGESLISRIKQYKVRLSPETISAIHSACQSKIEDDAQIFSIVAKDTEGNSVYVYGVVDQREIQTLTPQAIQQIISTKKEPSF